MHVVGALLASISGLGSPGCHHDRDAFYEPSGTAGAGDAITTEPPPLPALPDMEVRDACEACAMEKCRGARDACLEDDACTELLDCKGICDDPACLQECQARLGFSSWYDDLWACVFGQCPAECGVGRNWGCTGDYAWPEPERPTFEVTVRFRTPVEWPSTRETVFDSFLIGAEVRSCPPLDGPCLDPIDSGVVDAASTVDLSQTVTLGQIGYFEVESDTHTSFGQRELLYGYPAPWRGEVRWSYITRQNLAFLAGWVGSATSTSGAVAIMVGDCLGSPAEGARVTLPGVPEADVRHFRNLALSGDETDSGFAFAPAIPAASLKERVAVEAFRTDRDEQVAERAIWVRPGWITHAVLYPRPR